MSSRAMPTFPRTSAAIKKLFSAVNSNESFESKAVHVSRRRRILAFAKSPFGAIKKQADRSEFEALAEEEHFSMMGSHATGPGTTPFDIKRSMEQHNWFVVPKPWSSSSTATSGSLSTCVDDNASQRDVTLLAEKCAQSSLQASTSSDSQEDTEMVPPTSVAAFSEAHAGKEVFAPHALIAPMAERQYRASRFIEHLSQGD